MMRSLFVAVLICVVGLAAVGELAGQVFEFRRGRTLIRYYGGPAPQPLAYPGPAPFGAPAPFGNGYGNGGPVVTYGSCNGGQAGYSAPPWAAPPQLFGSSSPFSTWPAANGAPRLSAGVQFQGRGY